MLYGKKKQNILFENIKTFFSEDKIFKYYFKETDKSMIIFYVKYILQNTLNQFIKDNNVINKVE